MSPLTIGSARTGLIYNNRSSNGLINIPSDVTDPYFSNVSLLLHMDGSNGSTTFTDNSSSPKTVTRYSNAQISTTQSQFGGASGLFDGLGDYLRAPTQTSFAFDGDFTVEAWIRINTSPPASYFWGIFDTGNDGIRTAAMLLLISSSRKLSVFHNSGTRITTTASIPIGQWTHVALSRSSGVWRLFIDGTVDAATYTNTVNLSTGACIIGTIANSPGGGVYDFTGNIDDLRVTKNVARYNASFTPPTAAFPNS